MARFSKNKQGANGRFFDSAYHNKEGYILYFDLLQEIAISMFEWVNLPETCDERFLELALFGTGMSIFFKDDEIGHLALRCMVGGKLNVYNIPTERTAYASNGYNMPLDETNSVIIWNNRIHTPTVTLVERYSQMLWQIDETIRVNLNAQKTPILISCSETERLTLKNLYMQYEGNMPVIYGEKSVNPDSLKVLNTGAPIVFKDLYDLRTQRLNEVLTYLGISNVSFEKKERLLLDEVNRSQGSVFANRYSRLMARKQACEQINKMFGLDVDCKFREEFDMTTTRFAPETSDNEEVEIDE